MTPRDSEFGAPAAPTGVLQKFAVHIPPAQFGRYLLVGICNTVFGYGTYAALTALLTPRLAHAYIAASLISNLLAITFAFLAYKWFVFQTRGNYVREWLRCVLVYGATALIGTSLLPLLVFLLRRFGRFEASAPYLAGAILLALTPCASFLGHKNFSFARNHPDAAALSK